MSITPFPVMDSPSEPLDTSQITDVQLGNPTPDLSSAAPQTPDEPEEAGISESLLNTAKSVGFDDDDLDGLDEARIERMIAALDRRSVDAVRRLQQSHPTQVGVTGAAPAGPQPPVGAQPFMQPQQQQQPQPFKIELDDSYDDKLVATLKSMDSHYQQQIAQMQYMLNQTLQSQQQFATVQEDPTTRWFDGQLSGLGEEYQSVFGKGTINDIREGSAEDRNRSELFQTYDALKRANPTARDEELFQRALRASFGHVRDAASKKQLQQAAKNRSAQSIGRPSGRKSPANLDKHPMTGTSVSTIEAVQRLIDTRLER